MLTYLKASLLTIAFLICALIAYMLFTFNGDYEAHLALEAYQKGDYDKAEAIVEKLQGYLPAGRYHLNRAYIARGKRQMEDSNRFLQYAASEEQDRSVGLEIALNRAFNAYVMNDQAALQGAVKQASALAGPHDEWVELFASLGSRGNENPKEIVHLKPLSAWMKVAFESTFSPSWHAFRRTKREIEVGNGHKVRQQLKGTFDVSDKDDVQLLLGLSYLKEAEQPPAVVATPYFKLAFAYFGRVPMQKARYSQEREQIIQAVQKQFNELLSLKAYHELAFYAIALESLNAKPTVIELQKRLVERLEEALKDNQWATVKEISLVLNRLLLDPEKRQGVKKVIEEELQAKLDRDDFDHFQEGLEVAYLFSSNREDVSRNIQKVTLEKMLTYLPFDASDLFLTLPQIEGWLRVEQDPKIRIAFASELLSLAEALGHDQEQTEKASHLRLIASSIPALKDQQAFQRHVVSFQKTLQQSP